MVGTVEVRRRGQIQAVSEVESKDFEEDLLMAYMWEL